MKICFVFPSRERPDKFFRCLDNIQDMVSESDNYCVIAVLDNDDPSKEDYEKSLHEYPEVEARWGLSANKVAAINRELNNLPEAAIICLHSDDMWFTKFGFDEEIREAFKEWDGLVHFPDQVAKEKLITYTMMHRDYLSSLGYIYHNDFNNVYCDNFQHLQAQKLGKYKFVNKQILEHRHSMWGFGMADDLLRRTEEPIGYRKDHETFIRLKAEHGW